MGVWYTLKNGKSVQVCIIDNSEKYTDDKLVIKLFGGSTTFEYPINKAVNLNEIFDEIEKNYSKYEEEDMDFAYSCYAD